MKTAQTKLPNYPTIKAKNVSFLIVKEATGETCSNPEIIYEFMKAEAKIDRECVWVLHLNTRKQIIEKELVSMGSVNQSLLHPREVFKRAIVNGASTIIVVHNHPSGNVKQSEEDISCSKRLYEAGKLLGIPILDFIVIGDGYTSFTSERIGGFT